MGVLDELHHLREVLNIVLFTLLPSLLLKEIGRDPLIYTEGGGDVHLLDGLLGLALVLEDNIDKCALWLDTAFSECHDFAVASNFLKDLLGLDVAGEVLYDNRVPVLMVLDLTRVGVGVLHVEF